MNIKKAVITAAGPQQRALPLQSLIRPHGEERSVLAVLLEQILSAGIEEVCVIVWPGDESRYAEAAGPHLPHLRFLPQSHPRGYGHAIHTAHSFTAQDPFLHLVGDHLFIQPACVRRLLDLAQAEACAVSAVQTTRESLLHRYGVVGARRVPTRHDLYRIDTVLEKPTPTEAEQRLMIPGLRAGHYLCFFGMHVLTPTVMDILTQLLQARPDRGVTLSSALAQLATRERYLALQMSERRYDLGGRYGLLIAQLAVGLSGNDREEILAELVELLALRESKPQGGAQ